MTFEKQVSDKTLLNQVVQKLARSGAGSQTKITPTVSSGNVTLTGALKYDHDRRSILNAARNISGVRRVIDQMSVAPKKSNWA